MADFKLTQRHPSIHRITKDVSGAHNVINDTNYTILVGAIVEVTRGKGTIEHFDTETGSPSSSLVRAPLSITVPFPDVLA